MKTIGQQINIFLAKAGISASRLSAESGVQNAFISRLRSGAQKDTLSGRADAIRAAMRRLDPYAAMTALDDEQAVANA